MQNIKNGTQSDEFENSLAKLECLSLNDMTITKILDKTPFHTSYWPIIKEYLTDGSKMDISDFLQHELSVDELREIVYYFYYCSEVTIEIYRNYLRDFLRSVNVEDLASRNKMNNYDIVRWCVVDKRLATTYRKQFIDYLHVFAQYPPSYKTSEDILNRIEMI